MEKGRGLQLLSATGSRVSGRHVRKKSLDKLKDKIKGQDEANEAPNSAVRSAPLNGDSLERVIASLNPVWRGRFD